MKEKNKTAERNLTVALSLAVMLLAGFIPPPRGLTRAGMQVIGIFAGTLILWMKISIDWPSMLCMAALAFVPGVTVNRILTSGIGNATFAFLMFTFMCTYTLSRTPFIRRCAVAFVSLGSGKSPWFTVTMYFLRTLFLGAFISPTVLAVVMITVTEEIFSILGLEKGDRAAAMMMAGMVFCTGIAAGMTPIAHVFPIMAMGYYSSAFGGGISYAEYMAACVPAGLVCFVLMMLIFRFVAKPDLSAFEKADLGSMKDSLPRPGKREIYTLAIFFSVVFLWVAPGIFKPLFPALCGYIDGLGTAVPPLLGAVAMAVVTADGEPLLDFGSATGRGIPWASLIMVASTLALGAVMTDDAVGITRWISGKVAPVSQNLSPILLVLLFAFWRAMQTNLSSNMVTVTVVCAIAMPICAGLSGTVSAGAVACVIGMMASCAFATPPAMATVAFAIGSGWVSPSYMAKYGFLLMPAGILCATFIAYPIARLVI